MRYAFGILVLVAVIVTGGLLFSSREAPMRGDGAGFDPAVIADSLKTSDPYVISILGDSTSRMDGSWIYLVSAEIAETYNRTVTLHDWDIDSNSYIDTKTFGEGPPVTVWNGSGAGKPAKYSLQLYSEMAPEPADLTIINHTHNNPWGTVDAISRLVDVAYGNTRPGGGVVVTLQNPRTDSAERAALEEGVIDELRSIYSNPDTNVVMVDAYAAFQNGDLSSLLLSDGAHPSEEGSQLWAETVISTLKLR